jgi:putative NADH-flavin reductase
MRIAVIGGSGWLGATIAREAIGRGHEVTVIGRDLTRLEAIEGAQPAVVDATDATALVSVIAGHDVVVSSVTDRSGPDRSIIPAVARALIVAVPQADVPRLAMMGGGGSLLDDDGHRFVDAPDFPVQYKAEALAQSEALELLRAAPPTLDWTYLSPPLHDLTLGEKRGGYAVRGDDRPAVSETGESAITSGDLAAAMVDELETPQYSRRRFTAAYVN